MRGSCSRTAVSTFSSLALAAVLAAACGAGGHARGSRTRPSARAAQTRLFSPASVWNRQLAPNAQLDPRSRQLVAWLNDQVDREFTLGPAPEIETTTDSTPIYEVPADQPTVRVRLENDQPWAHSLARALAAVPIPADAQPAAGTDAHLTVWQPSTNRLWDLWRAQRTSTGWEAEWGGAMDNVSRSPGYFTTQSWPGAEPYWGATATSLPMAAGTMTIAELERGTINHALAIDLPEARAGEYAFPAQRTDGVDPDPDSIPEGAHLRLDPRLNVGALDLPPVIRMMALAAQRYGLIVRDQTGEAVAFFAQAPTAGTDPYTRIFGGVPSYDLLKRFPWSHLELLHMDLHHGTGAP